MPSIGEGLLPSAETRNAAALERIADALEKLVKHAAAVEKQEKPAPAKERSYGKGD